MASHPGAIHNFPGLCDHGVSALDPWGVRRMTNAGLPPNGVVISSRALREVGGSFRRIYLAPESRVMYMALNKNACTSLKWMMADLAGEDLSSFRAGLMPFVDDEEAIHNRDLWKKSPGFMSLNAAARKEIHPDTGWFIFAVIRDPRARFFSAWQNKMLLQHPLSAQWQGESWFPEHPVTPETIVRDFARFTEFMETHPDHRLRVRDPHFRSQTELLVQHAVPYSNIYDSTQIGQLVKDLSAHLAAQGDERALYLPRSNSTALRPNASVYTPEVLAAVERMYADDFAAFGHCWDLGKVVHDVPWSSLALAEIDMVSTLHRRIADLRDLALAERKRADAAELKTAGSEAESAPRATQARSLWRRGRARD